jgi:hypothetical protein
MKKYLLIGTIGLSLAFAVRPAQAHDELAYFMLGTIVGSVLARDSVPVVYHAPVYPAPVRYVPVYAPPAYYAPPPRVVIRHVYSTPPHHGVIARPRHPHGGPPGQRVRYQHKRR